MKKVLIYVGVVLSLLIAAVFIAPSFIDWTGYRSEIAQKVKEASGRDLLIGGDIVFSLLPSPVLRVSDVHLSNKEGAKNNDMVAIRQLDVRVLLLPLMGGNIHIESIRLIEPVIHLEMMANGQGNWVLKSTAQTSQNIDIKPQAGSPVFADDDSAQNQNAALPVQIDDFIIEKGQVIYTDSATGLVEHIDDLNSRFSLAGLNGPFEAAGTLSVRGIPLGFDASVGRIIHGRSASFASQIQFAHGKSQARFSGSFVNLTEGPKVQGKVAMTADSLAGFLSALHPGQPLAGGLDRAFGLEGEISFGPSGLILGKEGLNVHLGEDRAQVSVAFDGSPQRNLKANIEVSKLDGDIWLNAKPVIIAEPTPLPLVIQPSQGIASSNGDRVSAIISQPTEQAGTASTDEKEKPFSLPNDLEGQVSLSVEAIILKGQAIRQFQTVVSLSKGELALERASAIFPGAGEVSLIGVAGPRDGQIHFDGSLDVSVANLRGALNWADIDPGSVPSDRLQQVALRTEISATKDEISLSELTASMDSSKMKGAATIALRARPSFGVSLAVDRLNLDAYKSKDKTKSTPASTGDFADTSKQEKLASTQKSVSPQDVLVKTLQAMGQFDANLSLSLGHMIIEGHDIEEARLEATIYDGDVSIRKASVKDFAGLSLGVSGAIKHKDSSIMAENLTVTAKGKNWSDAADVMNAKSALNWAQIGALSISASVNGNVLAPDFDLNANMLGGSVIVSGSADVFPQIKGEASVNMQFPDVNRLVGGFAPQYYPSGKIGALDLNGDVAFILSETSVKNINVKLGETDMSGQLSVKQGARPFVDGDLQIGNLRLDPFMAVENSASKATASQNEGSGSSATTTEQLQRKKSHWSSEKIDLAALRSFDGMFKVKADSISHKNIKLEKAVLDAQLKDGILDVKNASSSVFGGEARLTSKLDVQAKPKLNLEVQAAGLDLAKVLKATDQGASAGGRISLSSALQSQGESEADLVSALKGVADMKLEKISVNQKSKAGSALDVLNLLAVLSGTDPKKGLADVVLKSEINQGVAVLKTANLTSNIASGSATGQVDLPKWTMDVAGTLNVQQNALIGLLAQKAKMKSDYPFSIRGDIDQPNVKLDTGGLSNGGGLVIPLGDKLEKKGVGNLLRGLLGGQAGTPAPTTAETPSTPADGSMAPPPPPPSQDTTTAPQKTSKEELILKGLGSLFKR